MEPDTLVLAIGGVPGEPFSVSPWEFNFRAGEAARQGRSNDARAILVEALERFPANASVLYNLACYEARDGEGDIALAHLQQAIDGEERFLEHARADPDFDAIRDDPRFPGRT
jgi:hypothetical protein